MRLFSSHAPATSTQGTCLARRSRRRVRGLTILEVMVAAGVLVITSMGGYSGFMLLNRHASNARDLSMARALCQERIEQALTLPFRPGASTPVVPGAPSSDPSSKADRTILGTASNYTAGAFTGTSNTQTSTETIPVYIKSEANSTAYGTVVYTRTTTLSAGGLNALASSGTAGSASLNTVLFTVKVSWVFRGNTYTTSMSTLRASD